MQVKTNPTTCHIKRFFFKSYTSLVCYQKKYMQKNFFYVFQLTKKPCILFSLLSYSKKRFIKFYLIKFKVKMKKLKKLISKNKYINILIHNEHIRITLSLYALSAWNTAYGIFLLTTGILQSSFWLGAISMYYFSLAIMRFFLISHTIKFKPSEKIKDELIKYRRCGITLLVMSLFLSLIIFFMVYWDRAFNYRFVSTIIMAIYTFLSLSLSIVNVIKYRKLGSPVFLASKNIGLASSCISLLALESAIITTAKARMQSIFTQRLILGITGGVVSAFIVGMALYMINKSNKKLKLIKNIEQQHKN